MGKGSFGRFEVIHQLGGAQLALYDQREEVQIFMVMRQKIILRSNLLLNFNNG
jgi:hypothetical protein